MTSHDVKNISYATGAFPVLRIRTDQDLPGGKVAPEAGKEAPVKTQEQPDLEALAAKLNIATQSIGRDLRFKIDMDSGNSVIQVLDRDTGELIREIPPEKAQFRVSGNGDMQIRLYDAIA